MVTYLFHPDKQNGRSSSQIIHFCDMMAQMHHRSRNYNVCLLDAILFVQPVKVGGDGVGMTNMILEGTQHSHGSAMCLQ
jgi:hypothetical protein